MPVPVPHVSKPSAHPVFKHPQPHKTDHPKPSVFRHLTLTLPVAPTGPPPSFGTREEWINSLPSWRRSKPRRIWEDDIEQRTQQHFQEGLTVADNASVIKGSRAQACIPPLFTLLQNSPVAHTPMPVHGVDEDADDELSSESSIMDHNLYDNESQWSASSPMDDDMDQRSQMDAMDEYATHTYGNEDQPAYDRGAFTPLFERDSPRRDVVSSPLGPITPFGEFVDRAVASPTSGPYPTVPVSYDVNPCGTQCYQESTYQQVELPKEPALPEPVVTPSASAAYKKLAEPLSEWVANYVWKVCTTGMSLPSAFSGPLLNGPRKQRSNSPPSFLATSVHSLLLSTLLQPSAVLLAMWYIVRLPVYFDAGDLGEDQVKETLFRVELLGDAMVRDAMEDSAPFRLILLGCMLANKWLDDHTFSNKTWHSISNVPIQSLNKLESLALDIFLYDLSVPSHVWSKWLDHIVAYHLSLSSPSHRQPISRPSCNPHSIVKKAIEELVHAPVTSMMSPGGERPEPVFLGLEERRREKLEKEDYIDVLEIDLDADGPLREEYLPKRRTSGASSIRSIQARDTSNSRIHSEKKSQWDRDENHLPPPAKWSPAGDEPILREKRGSTGNYVAVQPPSARSSLMPLSFPSIPYHPAPNGGYQDWPTTGGYLPLKQSAPRHVYDNAAHLASAYNAYTTTSSIPVPHSRPQSVSYDQENMQPVDHHRSYSQSQLEYSCSDIRMTTNELAPAPLPAAQWSEPYQHSYGQPFGVNYQATWLRT